MQAFAFEGSGRHYDYVIERQIGVAMEDGVTLYLDVYRPALKGKAVEGQWPVLLERSPYNKDRMSHSITGRYFAQRGYI